MERGGLTISLAVAGKSATQGVQHQIGDGEALLKGGGTGHGNLLRVINQRTGENGGNGIVGIILAVKLVIGIEGSGDGFILQILAHQFLSDRKFQSLVVSHELGEILPAAGGDKGE